MSSQNETKLSPNNQKSVEANGTLEWLFMQMNWKQREKKEWNISIYIFIRNLWLWTPVPSEHFLRNLPSFLWPELHSFKNRYFKIFALHLQRMMIRGRHTYFKRRHQTNERPFYISGHYDIMVEFNFILIFPSNEFTLLQDVVRLHFKLEYLLYDKKINIPQETSFLPPSQGIRMFNAFLGLDIPLSSSISEL